jgi:carbonic anhydrase
MPWGNRSRRLFSLEAATLLAGAVVSQGQPRPTEKAMNKPPSAEQVLATLVEGNRHFSAGALTHPGRSPSDFRQLAESQKPIAAILGCADSRVPPEILFDQPIGSLFVVRVAGNYVSGAGSAVKGSLEYAVAELNVPLIVVLGHSGCGAVKAAIQHIHAKDTLPGAIEDLVNNIKPAVLEAQGKKGDPLEAAIQANVARGTQKLDTLEPILAPRVKAGALKVMGMTYDLKTGLVHVLST